MTKAITKHEADIMAADFMEKVERSNKYKLDVRTELMYAVQLMQKNDTLANCSVDSIKMAVIQSVMSGMSLDPVWAEAYLVPRKGKAVFSPGYKGLRTAMKDMGVVGDIYAEVVYEGDDFKVDFGLDRTMSHTPYHILGTKKGKEKGAYAVALLAGGTKKWEYVNMDYIEAVQKASPGGTTSYSPWQTAFRPSMIKKAAIRYLIGQLPKVRGEHSERLQSILAADNDSMDLSKVSKITTGDGKEITPQTTLEVSGVVERIKGKADVSQNAEVLPEMAQNEPQGVLTVKQENFIKAIEKKGGLRPMEELATIQKALKDASGLEAEVLMNAVKDSEVSFTSAIELCRKGTPEQFKTFFLSLKK